MVDVSEKAASARVAVAEAYVRLAPATAAVLRERTGTKGDALVAAQIAGIMAAKRTADLIPLAHSLALAQVDVALSWMPDDRLRVEATARTVGPTGVELEAMTAASIAALTVYDMAKAVERGITIDGLRLIEKRGGKSGAWRADP